MQSDDQPKRGLTDSEVLEFVSLVREWSAACSISAANGFRTMNLAGNRELALAIPGQGLFHNLVLLVGGGHRHNRRWRRR
jgi:hypothetical protein